MHMWLLLLWVAGHMVDQFQRYFTDIWSDWRFIVNKTEVYNKQLIT